MASGIWGRRKDRQPRGFAEKVFRREPQAAWDARWHRLSAPARRLFLTEVKGPTRKQGPYTTQPSVPADRCPPGLLRELVDAGFVEIRPSRPKVAPDRVFAFEGLIDLATRVRALHRHNLLAADLPSEFAKYVDYAFYSVELAGVIAGVLRRAGIEDLVRVEDALRRYVVHHRWPGWVARALKDPLAERLLGLIREADGPIPLAELPGRLPGSDPDKVRAALDGLVTHLALVEGLHPRTSDLVVGLLPAVREELARASQPRHRPPLQVCESPREVGPEGSLIVDDLRAVLLEVAGEPPRLRQDKAPFHKETGRFLQGLGTLPSWLAEALGWSAEGRLGQALGWARVLKLVKETAADKQTRLGLSARANGWLAGDLVDQDAEVFDVLRAPASRAELYSPQARFFYPGLDPFSNVGPGDARFLGINLTVIRATKGKRPAYFWDVKPEDHEALREALYRAFAELPPGVFHRLDSVVEHLVFDGANPLLLGHGQDEVVVSFSGRPVPPLEEQREEAGRLLLDALVRRRLIPLGCLRAAIDAEGRLLISRAPSLDAYFGKAGAGADRAGAPSGESRVVVQPDFSIVVIGLNPAPVAELAPFCDRSTRGGGPGAVVLKLTRESVVKAVSLGLKPAEIVARLKRHASNEVSANVLAEVQG